MTVIKNLRRTLLAPRAVPAVATAVLATVTLVACTDDQPAPSSGPTAETRTDVNAQERGALQRGGTLRQPVTSISGPWNPLATNGVGADWDRIREPLLPRFFRYDAAGVPTPDPNFLVSATQTAVSPTTIDYRLNPKAVWGDGSPVDGDDMIATWKACNGSDDAFRCARTDTFGQVANVTTGADKWSVTVTFTGVYPDWTGVFDEPGVLKAESVKDATTFNSGWNRLDNDWLSGPFRFDNYNAADGVLTEAPNERWWGDQPMLDQLLWRVVPADEQAAAYTDHRIDAYALGAADASAARALPASTVHAVPGRDIDEVVINTGGGLLADQTLRQALAQTIDRTALAVAGQGSDPAPTVTGHHLLLPGEPGYADHGTATDAVAAQAALDAAGWTKGTDGFRVKGDTALNPAILVDRDDAAATAEARLLSTQLDAVGIRSEVTPLSGGELAERLGRGDFALVVRARTLDRSIGADVAVYTGGSATNVSRFQLDRYDDLARQIATATEPAARLTAVDQADQALWDAVPSLPVAQRIELVLTPTTLANFGAFGLSSVDYENVGYLR